MPITAYYRTPDKTLQTSLDQRAIMAAYESRQGLLWVDISQATDEENAFFRDAFGFHPLATDDCISIEVGAPKVDDYRDYLFILANGINYMAASHIVETTELGLFLGPSFVVTYHRLPLYSVDSVKQLVEGGGPPIQRGADLLAHAVLDALAHNIVPAVDILAEQIDDVEDQAITTPHVQVLQSVQAIKRSIQCLQRRISPQKEVYHRLSRGEFPLVSHEASLFFRDLYDLATWIEGMDITLRERTDNALTAYLSSIANKQNETMRVLSIAALIFLPPMLIAGIYGMNFRRIPELTWRGGYYYALGLIGASIFLALAFFWGKQWISWGRRVAGVRPMRVDRSKLRGYKAPKP